MISPLISAKPGHNGFSQLGQARFQFIQCPLWQKQPDESTSDFSLSAASNEGRIDFMRTVLLAALVVATCPAVSAADPKMVPVMELNGHAYVSATELERSASVAIKPLPGSDAVVACSEDRCARVQDVLREGKVTWVSATELANALGFAARFSDDRRQVRFEAGGKPPHAGDPVTRVGDLAPNFRLARLDGSPVSLADFRGRRVLIQSWASW